MSSLAVERFVPVHPIVDALPAVPESRVAILADDIAKHGLRKPLALLDGRVWDGRARRLACALAGVKPLYWVLRREEPVAFFIENNAHVGQPRSEQRYQILSLLLRLRDPAVLTAERHRRALWMKRARQEFRNFAPPPQPCAVCGDHLQFVHAHHSLPLALQYDLGIEDPDHTHDWLCPTHHKIVHVFISINLYGSRDGELLDHIPDRFHDEWVASEDIFHRGSGLFVKYAGVSDGVGRWSYRNL